MIFNKIFLLLYFIGNSMDTFDSDKGKDISKEVTKCLDELEITEEKEIQKAYFDYLKEEGYRPKIDSDGDVCFKHEGRTYFIDVPSRDTEFFRVVLPIFWSVDSEAERVRILEAASYANAKAKVSKVYIIGDHVWASAEIFVAKPERFKEVFHRMIGALDNGIVQFVKKIQELNDD